MAVRASAFVPVHAKASLQDSPMDTIPFSEPKPATTAAARPDMTRPKLERIGAASHRGLAFRPAPDFSFASRVGMVPIVAAELSLAALNYPLAFLPTPPADPQAEAAQPTMELVGLLSIEEKRNLFVAANGAWLTDFVPASIGTYPFRYRPGSGGGHAALYADMASGLLGHGPEHGGDPLFGPEGKPSPKMRQIVGALQSFEKSRRLTQKVCGQVLQAGLLVPWGETKDAPSLARLMRVDEPRLQKLGLRELDALRKSGALLLIYAHLLSLAGLARLHRLTKVHASAERERKELFASCFRENESIEDTFTF